MSDIQTFTFNNYAYEVQIKQIYYKSIPEIS